MAEKHKNLVTCKPTEFLRQTNKIRKAAEKWLDDTEILKIRSRKVEGLKTFKKDATDEEKAEIIKHNAAAVVAQRKKNISEILENIMEKYPEETLELLAIMCFVEPENVDDYSISFYLQNFSEIMSDKAVLGFFTSLAQLGQMDISD